MGTPSALPYDSLYRHGFARVSVCVPRVRVSDVEFNTNATLESIVACHKDGASLAVFPELGLTGYSNDDLFQQDALLDAASAGLAVICRASAQFQPLILVGLPVRHDGTLYNAAAAIHGGRLLGVVPKSYVPAYREFYEKRQFSAGAGVSGSIDLLEQTVPFGPGLIFRAPDVPGFAVAPEICEDLWVPAPPSTFAALAGATILANLSASNITIGKSEYRRRLGRGQSATCIAAYLYAAAGTGESTTDLAWDGDAHIHENGKLLASGERFSDEPQIVTADVHLAALVQDRTRMTSFNDNRVAMAGEVAKVRQVDFELRLPAEPLKLRRVVARFPYVPAGAEQLNERCFEAYNIQVEGLVTRMRAIGEPKLVVGVSGGLDSTQALLVSVRAMDLVGRPRTHVLAYTMPGFATGERTLKNARRLMEALDVSSGEIDIRESCMQVFKNIGHPFADGHHQYDVTFENVQAGERTSHLFRLANLNGGLVVGTGDLSELALGWATYGVGDHMSHYAVNASVPKTLVQYLIRWVADRAVAGESVRPVLNDILDTEISPELVPSTGAEDQPGQRSEDSIGPYELQDFHLYYITRYGLRPSSVAYLAACAWEDAEAGVWPDLVPPDKRRSYSRDDIKHWLKVFLERFFGLSQFKRSCIPNGPKVGSGGSLSPRGDWRAPSDSSPKVWLDELETNMP